MNSEVHIARQLVRPVVLFSNRADAGRMLSAWIRPTPDPGAVVFALPRGGIPAGRPLADALGCALLPALVRKLPIPGNPEMGFGAVTVDGTVRLNGPVMEAFSISEGVAGEVIAQVRAEVQRRGAAYPGGWPLPDLVGRDVWLVDDGLATGLTMLSAADMLRTRGPRSLSIAVPCAPSDSIARVAEVAESVWCLAALDGHTFAVASFYRDFHDMTDAEVLVELRR
jgi:predicted phosphoribosyltransferase